MIYSLRFRLALAFTLVILIAISTVSLFTSLASSGKIHEYQEHTDQSRCTGRNTCYPSTTLEVAGSASRRPWNIFPLSSDNGLY